MTSAQRARELRDYRLLSASEIRARHDNAALALLEAELSEYRGECRGRLDVLRANYDKLRPVWADATVGFGGAGAAVAGAAGLVTGPITSLLAILGAAGTGIGLPLALLGAKWTADGLKAREELKMDVDVAEVETEQLRSATARIAEARALPP
jgi:hypothetical protein